MPVTGGQIVAKNLSNVMSGFIRHTNKTMDDVRKILEYKITQNISLTDHSLEDLAAMDHPYAARHGAHGMEIHDPYYQVHNQGGRLLESKKSGTIPASLSGGKLTAIAYVGLDESIAKHAPYVVFGTSRFGTSRMIPRPVLEGSRDEVIEQAVTLIKKELTDIKLELRG